MPAPLLLNSRLAAQLQDLTGSQFYGDKALLTTQVDTGQKDAYNNPIVTPSDIPIDCSFEILTAGEAWQRYGDLENIVAEIRFAGPRPTKGNQVKIVSRFGGQPLPSRPFEIAGINDRAALGFVCPLKLVEQ